MVFNESGELFELRQQFFSGQYDQVSTIQLDEFSEGVRDVAKEYVLRSLVYLGEYDEVLSRLAKEPESTLNKTIELYTNFIKTEQASEEFEALISNSKKQWYVQILGSFYLIKIGKIEEAIELLHHHEDSLENVLILVQLYIHQNKLELAKKEITNAAAFANDSIIYNLAEGYYSSVVNGESLRGSLYFFEELSHSNPTFKTLIGQLVFNLQLHQFPEAEVVLGQLEELSGQNVDLIANEIAYANITGDLEKAQAKRDQLTKLAPEHPTLVDYKAKNELFDSIVEKYSEQIVN